MCVNYIGKYAASCGVKQVICGAMGWYQWRGGLAASECRSRAHMTANALAPLSALTEVALRSGVVIPGFRLIHARAVDQLPEHTIEMGDAGRCPTIGAALPFLNASVDLCLSLAKRSHGL